MSSKELSNVAKNIVREEDTKEIKLSLMMASVRRDEADEAAAQWATALKNLPAGHSIIADLQDQSLYIFPPHLARTDLRLQIVVLNDTMRSIVLFELTDCHKSYFIEAHQWKVNSYLDLEEEI